MKVEIDGFNGGFWARNSLRALLAWLWFDHGRWVSFYGGESRPIVGVEIIILISVVLTLALEAFCRREGGKEDEKDG